MNEQSTCLSEERHVSRSPSQDLDTDWLIAVVTSPLSLSDFLSQNSPSGSFGKTYRVCSVAQEGRILPQSSQLLQDEASGLKSLPKVELSKETLAVKTEQVTLLPTAFLIANISECHSAADVSLLSDVLETTGDHLFRYSLSAKACAGILRRAENRGKKTTGFTPTSFGGYGEGVDTLKKSGGDLGGGGSETLVWPADIASTLDTTFGTKYGLNNQHINSGASLFVLQSYGIPGNWIGRKPENGGNAVEPMHDVAPCQTKTDKHAVAYSIQGSMVGRNEANGPQGGGGVNEEISFTLNTTDRHAVAHGIAENPETAHCLRAGASKADKPSSTTYVTGTPTIRRLTPTECERLQGFPDGYTLIPKAADGPRYKALGNSMTTNVMKWIGTRIEAVNTLLDVL